LVQALLGQSPATDLNMLADLLVRLMPQQGIDAATTQLNMDVGTLPATVADASAAAATLQSMLSATSSSGKRPHYSALTGACVYAGGIDQQLQPCVTACLAGVGKRSRVDGEKENMPPAGIPPMDIGGHPASGMAPANTSSGMARADGMQVCI
jgi:hypothetical protein